MIKIRPNDHRHPYERPLFLIAAVITILLFLAGTGIAVYKEEVQKIAEKEFISSYREKHPDAKNLSDAIVLTKLPQDNIETLDQLKQLHLALVFCVPIGIVVLILLAVGRMYGDLRSNGIKVGPDQFPQVYALWRELALQLGFTEVPDLFIKNGNGTLNAFATCIPGGRSFGAIYSDILERALEIGDEDTLRFVLGHELGHIRLGHVKWWSLLIGIIANLPGLKYVLGLPLSRAREYGCDKIGHQFVHDNECRPLLMLAAGKHLYRQVDVCQYEHDHINHQRIWDAIYNFTIDHPSISWRIAALRQCRHGDLIWAKRIQKPARTAATDKSVSGNHNTP